MSAAPPASTAPPIRIPTRPARAAGSGRTVLRRVSPEDLAEVRRWDSDRDLVVLYGAPPSGLAAAAPRFLLAIEADGRFVGLIALSGVSRAMRSAELQVVIGRRSDWGQGLGRNAVETFLSHVLATTALDFIYLRTLLGNERAIQCYENCGFRRAGILRVRHDPRYATPPLGDDILLMTYSRLS